jgi:hypothetical protein
VRFVFASPSLSAPDFVDARRQTEYCQHSFGLPPMDMIVKDIESERLVQRERITSRRRAALRSGKIALVRAFDSTRHVPVAVIDFVNLLHADDGFFRLPHSPVNDAEIVHDLLLHCVH